MLYGVCESTNLRATHYGERMFDCVAKQDIENGMVGHMTGLADGFDHIYNFEVGAPTDGSEVCLVIQPAWSEDECRKSNQRRDKFFIPAGTPFRVYVMKQFDEFAVNIMAIQEASREKVEGVADFTATDMFLTVGEDGKFVAADKATEGAVMEARIMRKRIVGDTIVTDARNYGYKYEMYTAKITALA